MTEKMRFAIVAAASLIAGSALTALIFKLAYKQDLEFLSMAKNFVEEGLAELKDELGE